MRPGPSAASKVLPELINVSDPPRSAKEWLVDICMRKGWAEHESEALEQTERWRDAFLQYLTRDLNELRKLGRFSYFEFNSSSPYYIQGSAFVEPKDAEDLASAKRRRARFEDYVEVLEGLSPDDFELLCTGILRILGVKKPRKTPYSADEGIDFYGRLDLEGIILENSLLPSVDKQLSSWMIGQAKHYQSIPVSTPDIRDLVGAVELARGRAFASGDVENKYRDLAIGVCDPVFYLFFTTGRITIDGWKLLDVSGTVGMDGHMLAAFLADHGVGIDRENNFNSGLFVEWIKSS